MLSIAGWSSSLATLAVCCGRGQNVAGLFEEVWTRRPRLPVAHNLLSRSCRSLIWLGDIASDSDRDWAWNCLRTSPRSVASELPLFVFAPLLVLLLHGEYSRKQMTRFGTSPYDRGTDAHSIVGVPSSSTVVYAIASWVHSYTKTRLERKRGKVWLIWKHFSKTGKQNNSQIIKWNLSNQNSFVPWRSKLSNEKRIKYKHIMMNAFPIQTDISDYHFECSRDTIRCLLKCLCRFTSDKI